MFTRAPVLLSWDLCTAAPQDAAWALLADTDRFNRAAGLDFAFEVGPDGRTFGRVQSLGMEHQWEEEPWQFEAPRWFRSRRRFLAGPVAHIDLQLALEPLSDGRDGTRVRYDVALHPRAAAWRPVLAVQAAAVTRPQLDRALRAALRLLDAPARSEQPAPSYDPPPPPLGRAARLRLDRALASLPGAQLGVRLGQHLHEAPLAAQDRLRPLALARAWGIAPPRVVAGMLAALRAGVLELRWDLLCPSCGVAQAATPALGEGPDSVHCASCSIAYDAAFPDNVEVVLRPAPWLRKPGVAPVCAMSPGRTPHLLLRRTLRPDKPLEAALSLDPGAYRLSEGRTSLHLEVGVPGAPHTLDVDVGPRGLVPRLARLGPGPATLRVRNRLSAEVELTLEDRRRPPDTLTAGALLQDPANRALLPPEALRPGLDVRVLHGAVLALDHPGVDLREAPTSWRGNGVALGVWPALDAALAVSARFAGDPHGACGIELGGVLLVDGVPSGEAVDAALAALRRAPAGGQAFGPTAQAQAGAPARPEVLFELPEDQPPAAVPGFRVGALVGEGGFGRVYAAEEVATGAQRVLKVLKPEHSAHPDRVQRFFNEGRMLADLVHPNTARVYDWGETPEGLLYLVMERLDGRELAAVLAEDGRLDPDRARRIAADALAALEAVHARGIVHRDVKPGNLLLCEGPEGERACLIDFGIARATGERLPKREEGMVLGTPSYMSPEQVQARVDIDGRADLYALGATLYECLSGSAPFQGPTNLAIAMRRLKDPPPPLDPAQAPPALRAAVMRAMEREPEARWPDAASMRQAIEEEGGGAPGS